MNDRKRRIRPDQVSHRAQEPFGTVPAFSVKGVGDCSVRETLRGIANTADREERNHGKPLADDRKEFKSRHFRHVEVGDDNVGQRMFKLDERIKAVLCS